MSCVWVGIARYRQRRLSILGYKIRELHAFTKRSSLFAYVQRWASMVGPSAPPLAASPSESPREHRSRAPEFYGFVAWSSTSFLFVVYVLWALLPDRYIHRLGITWYPNREWAILLPAYSIVLVLLTYITYFSLALARTPAFSDVSAFVDAKAHLPVSDTPNPYLLHENSNAVVQPYDIPIGIVNRVMYGPNHAGRGPRLQ